MSGFPALLNFRSTLAYVTDGAGETCAHDGGVADHGESYDITRNGLDFGDVLTNGDNNRTRNRNAAVDRRFAGFWHNETTNQQVFRLDLKSDGNWLSAGDYTVRMACGDYSYARTTTVVCVDGASSGTLFTASGATGGANRYLDATSVARTSPADWVSNNAAQTVTVTGATPYLLFQIGNNAGTSTGFLTHLEVAAVAEAPPALTPPSQFPLSILGIGMLIRLGALSQFTQPQTRRGFLGRVLTALFTPLKVLLVCSLLTLSCSQASADTAIPNLATWEANMITYGDLWGVAGGHNILSSTNTTPIQINTTGAHNLGTGYQIIIENHDHAAANGTWTVTFVDGDTFSLDTSVGTQAGTATGIFRRNSVDIKLDATFYDGMLVYQQIYAYTGLSRFATYAQYHKEGFLDGYVTPNNGAVPGYWNFSEGMTAYWTRTGLQAAKDGTLNMALHSSYATDSTPASAMNHTMFIRENSYAIINYLDAESLGATHRTKYDELVEHLIGDGGFVDQVIAETATDVDDDALSFTDLVIGTPNTTVTSIAHPFDSTYINGEIRILSGTGFTPGLYRITNVVGVVATLDAAVGTIGSTGGTGPFYRSMIHPFMMSLMMHAMTRIWDYNADSRIPAKIKLLLDYLWTDTMRQVGGANENILFYRYYTGTVNDGIPTGDGVLNNLISPFYAWYYKYSHDTTYRDRGNLLFSKGVTATDLSVGSKQFNQNYLMSFKYVEWYNQATAVITTPASLTRTSASNGPMVSLIFPPSEGSPLGYKLYRGIVSGTLSLIRSVTSTVANLTHTPLTTWHDVPPLAGTYYYAVSSYDGSSESAKSSEVSVTVTCAGSRQRCSGP